METFLTQNTDMYHFFIRNIGEININTNIILFVHYFLPRCFFKGPQINILSATGKISYFNNARLSAEVSETVENNTEILFHKLIRPFPFAFAHQTVRRTR